VKGAGKFSPSAAVSKGNVEMNFQTVNYVFLGHTPCSPAVFCVFYAKGRHLNYLQFRGRKARTEKGNKRFEMCGRGWVFHQKGRSFNRAF